MDSDYFGASYNEWVKAEPIECPECGYPAPERQVDTLERCERCWFNDTQTDIQIEDEKEEAPEPEFEESMERPPIPV